MRRSILAAFLMLLVFAGARADVFRPAYLELRQRAPDTYDVLWKVPAQGEMRLALDLRMPEGTITLQAPHAQFVGNAYVERSRIRHPQGLEGRAIAIDGLAGSGTDVLVRVLRSDGTEQVTRLLPSQTSFTLEPVAGGFYVAKTYFALGVHHILAGFDHLLFVLALLLIVRGVRRVIVTITAFTVAHSITLAAATLGWVHVPSAPVEATIALSIVFVAAEIVHGVQGRPGLTARWPWVVAFTFGLLHGFGFAGALHEVGLPEQAIPLALLFFNVGVEAGQLIFVSFVALLVAAQRRLQVRWPRWAEYAPAYAIGTLAMYWVIERVADFASA
jgi:hydrogenase/urease accessory protein HupE